MQQYLHLKHIKKLVNVILFVLLVYCAVSPSVCFGKQTLPPLNYSGPHK